MSLKKIVLHGYLKEFGVSFDLDVSTPAEAVRALRVQIKGFEAAIRKGEFRVIRGKNKLKNAIEERELLATFGRAEKLHIVPVAIGSKNNGLLKVILGVALIGVSFAVGAGALGAQGALFGIKAGTFLTLGAGMLLNGIGQMLSPTPETESNESPASRPSYMFGGAQNLTQEGNIIPVAYGKKVWCGSLVVSAGMDVQEVQ